VLDSDGNGKLPFCSLSSLLAGELRGAPEASASIKGITMIGMYIIEGNHMEGKLLVIQH